MNFILLLTGTVLASPIIGLPGKNVNDDSFDECK